MIQAVFPVINTPTPNERPSGNFKCMNSLPPPSAVGRAGRPLPRLPAPPGLGVLWQMSPFCLQHAAAVWTIVRSCSAGDGPHNGGKTREAIFHFVLVWKIQKTENSPREILQAYYFPMFRSICLSTMLRGGPGQQKQFSVWGPGRSVLGNLVTCYFFIY